MNNEHQIRQLVENWAKAAREKDYDGIMAWHHPDIVMYDVRPPFESKGPRLIEGAASTTGVITISGLEFLCPCFKVDY